MILFTSFDTNDWFVVCAAIVNLALMHAVRQYLNVIQGTMIWLFNFMLAVAVDHLVADNHFDMYDVMDLPKVEFMDLFLYLFVYPPPMYLFLTLYCHFTRSRFARIALTVGFAFAITGLERLAHEAHVYAYYEWKLVYSFFTYIGALSLNLLFMKWVRKQTNAA